jgi:hypothetical protein
MTRTIGAVVLGYLVMAVLIFATFSGAYLAMGADAAFRRGTFDPSSLWIIVSFILGFGAAVAGGWVCAAVARDGRAVSILAIVVLVLGLISAVPTLRRRPTTEPRLGDVPNMEAMTKAHTPTWIAFLNPFLGVAGLLLGGRLSGRRP